jgi:hypothetical protein
MKIKMHRIPYLINLWEDGFSLTKPRFSAYGGYANFDQETADFLTELNAYNYDKIISLHKQSAMK